MSVRLSALRERGWRPGGVGDGVGESLGVPLDERVLDVAPADAVGAQQHQRLYPWPLLGLLEDGRGGTFLLKVGSRMTSS